MLIEEKKQSQLDLFQENLPAKPYCSDDLNNGLIIRASATAITKKYLQHNKPTTVKWLAFDCDFPNAIEVANERELPRPNIAVINKHNGHSHLLYGLDVGVHRTHIARAKPLAYLAKIEHSLRDALTADQGYAGLIVKNPMHEHWLTYELRPDCYDMGELAEYLTLPAKLPAKPQGLGRNCTLFEVLRRWAYREVLAYRLGSNFEGFKDAVLVQAMAFNNFESPLPRSEVLSTAKSIAKWTWNTYTGRMPDAEFSELQGYRQSKQVEARHRATQDLRSAAKALYEAGNTQSEIATQLGRSQATIQRWVK